ncbi:sensor histidine kinase [Sporolactobacillus terrae]|uniref:histidine kinase n=1 Tax=Sporolactobacillus terrae TaxID=269673 RepID=A0A410D9B1_9BACL|nr:HAMP domain-containing sensor histidine kinase [Sporolactobacillus terrae]QAA22677.1 two-component sensor histidine kinase [Sporolactobacillus terrae]QAA25650.1 two-component sensor histidine kinase [Sporolactobacillus terrae]UAK17461.1 two-component sensor histidine kinase [Sporolactobacillus terrae]BBN99008.1 two-component sensor histidine kinase [Sporolactobacillus terrae]
MKNQCSSKLKVHSLAILLLLSIVVYWVLFYFLLELFFSWLRVAIHPILLHVASALLGLALFAFVMAQVGKYMKPKRISYFQTIIQAIRQMAKGNFEINLDIPLPTDQKSRHNPFVQLVDSVHYMAKELGQLERVRQEFISNVSHEIQSPLTSIKGFARALENDRLPENKRMHYLNIIQKEADRLSKLSDNLMKLTALENTKHPIRLSNYRLDRQIRSCLLALEPQWTKKALDMTIELDPITIDADIDLMNQVWMNLIHNSIKFTPEHGKLQVELSIRDGRIMFCLSDTGIGIKKEDFVHLFERFYKADRSRTKRQEGNGLGLSIVKKIIDVHHGEIHVQSEYQKGTRFTILLNKSG